MHVKLPLKIFFPIVNCAWIGLQNQKYLCSCSPKPRVQWQANWQGPLAGCHSHLRLQGSPRGRQSWILFNESHRMAFVSWWTVGLLLRQTRWKPFKSHFLWLWDDQRTEEVVRIEIMLFVILWHNDKTIKLKINVPAPTG